MFESYTYTFRELGEKAKEVAYKEALPHLDQEEAKNAMVLLESNDLKAEFLEDGSLYRFN